MTSSVAPPAHSSTGDHQRCTTSIEADRLKVTSIATKVRQPIKSVHTIATTTHKTLRTIHLPTSALNSGAEMRNAKAGSAATRSGFQAEPAAARAADRWSRASV